MSINKLISIKNPIVDAMDQLGIDYIQDIPVFTRWAVLAEKNIGSYFQFELKRKVIDIVGCTACLPEDAAFLQMAILGDLGDDCANLFTTACSQVALSSATLNASAETTTFLIVDMGTGYTSYIGSIPHVVQNNKVILNQNLDGQSLTVQYLGYKCDEEGFLMVGENHIQAITWFIIWRYYFRMKRKNSLDYGQMNKAEQEWHRECANSRARDGAPTDSEQQEMAMMIANPYSGNSLGVGMFSTLSNTNW
jgi:hypothetical protein